MTILYCRFYADLDWNFLCSSRLHRDHCLPTDFNEIQCAGLFAGVTTLSTSFCGIFFITLVNTCIIMCKRIVLYFKTMYMCNINKNLLYNRIIIYPSEKNPSFGCTCVICCTCVIFKKKTYYKIES